MPWTRKKISDLNHIIAGPMVRKVTEKEVSIWVAVKSPATITLKVYEPGGTSPLMFSGALPPVRVGKDLYIACVTASKPSNVLTNYTTVYGYDLEFNFLGSGIKYLQSDGILDAVGSDGIKKVTYDNSTETYKSTGVKLPGFLIPPPTVNDLNLFHGSCRKPHGEGVDALTVLHDRIKQSIGNTSVKRPQLLCLTGDQIYADDVSELLLHQIDQYHNDVNFPGTGIDESLIGWKENMEEIHSEVTPDLMELNERYKILDEKINIPAVDKGAAKNHLIRFSEFILMYCMVWSDELWKDDIPSYFDMNELPTTNQVDVKRTIDENGQTEEHQTTTYANPGDYDVSDRKLRKYAEKHEDLKRFRKGLPKVRKALANISTLMVFDDHDVTDDWFFNQKWCLNVLYGQSVSGGSVDLQVKSLGRRLMTNGMTAIALCQSWGNTPEQFIGASTPGKSLVDNLNLIHDFTGSSSPTTDNTYWTNLGNIVLPVVNLTAPIPRLEHSSSGLDWHWYYERTYYEIIGLDTRTMRSFRNEFGGIYENKFNKDAPGLLSDQAIDTQIKLAGKVNLTDPPLDKELTILISGAPIFGVTDNESRLRLGFAKFIPSEVKDFESWNLDPHARQTLISKLLERTSTGTGGTKTHRVVTLSGDVHYAYTNFLHYRAKETYNTNEIHAGYGLELKMGQFCASSMKNLTTGKNSWVEKHFSSTLIQHNTETEKVEDSNEIVCGWNTIGNLNYRHGKRVVYDSANTSGWFNNKFVKPNTNPPHMVNLKDLHKRISDTISPQGPGNIPSPKPDWYYDLTFKIASPEIPGITPSGIDTTSPDKLKLTEYHRTASENNGLTGGSYIVGYPNIGDVTFNWTGSNMEAIHNIIWINKSGQDGFDNDEFLNDKYVSTQHVIDLQ